MLNRLAVGFMLGPLLLANNLVSAQSTPGSGRRQIVVDLGNQQLQGTLPFDVDFDFTGPVPADAKRLVVQWRDVTDALESPTAKTCLKIAGDSASSAPREQRVDVLARMRAQCTNTILLPPDSQWSTSNRRAWEATGLTGADPKFIVTIPALDAERSFVFRFTLERAVAPERLAAYRTAVVPELRAILKGVAGTSLDVAGVQELRTAARDVLQKLLGRYEVLAKDPIFDPQVPPEQALSLFAPAVNTPILVSEDDRKNGALKTYDAITAGLEDSLRAIRDLRELRRGIRAMERVAGLAKLLGEHRPAIDLILLDDDEIRRLAQGSSAGATSPALASVEVPAEVEGFLTRYQQLHDRLVDLRSVLRQVLDPEGPYAEAIGKPPISRQLSRSNLRTLRLLSSEDGALAHAVEAVKEAMSTAIRVRTDLAKREQGLVDLAATIGLSTENVAVVSGNTIGDFNTLHGAYVSADAGLLYAFGIDGVLPYIGTNIYFRPVNKDAPLSLKGGLGRRVALTLGLTVRSVADDAGTRDDLFGSQAGVVGLGVRVRQSIRLAGGMLVFEKKVPSLLRTDKKLTANPFLAMSFDIDVGGLPAALGGIFK
jgi:hypothetical protein